MEAAYESLIDTTSQGCNNPSLAASALTAIENAEAWVVNYGRDSSNRGHYYEVNSQSDDQDTIYNPAGSVSINVGSDVAGGKRNQLDERRLLRRSPFYRHPDAANGV